MHDAFEQVQAIDEHEFLVFIIQQGLASMWGAMLQTRTETHPFTGKFLDRLHQQRLINTGRYLLQRHSITRIKTILDAAKIPHVVYKGASIRERLYADPALRPAADIDVLVSGKHKQQTIQAFTLQGYELHASADIVSHEVSLKKGNASIDLHWDILRPGRTRIPIADTLLNSRIDYASHWGMSTEASLFIMLVHPVFAKYGTSPNATLMRSVDLSLILEEQNINWQTLQQWLDNTGLKTAAWLTLSWHALLTNRPAPAIMTAIQPGKLRQRYLNHWLKNNYSSKLFNRPFYIQLGFTLPAHDKPSDALRAVRKAQQLKRTQQSDLKFITPP